MKRRRRKTDEEIAKEYGIQKQDFSGYSAWKLAMAEARYKESCERKFKEWLKILRAKLRRLEKDQPFYREMIRMLERNIQKE